MKRFFLPAVFLIAGCQLPSAETDVLTADSYLSRVPPVKTAVVHLLNEDVSKDDIEYKQFMDRLKPVLEEKGYRLTSPAAVVLRLKFGVNKEGTISVKSNVETVVPDHPVDEPVPAVTTMYDRKPVYEKFISLTAVQAGKEDRQFWKARVSKTDFSPDFRTARDKLLYLLSHFIEKDSVRRVSAPLSEAEFYQRYVLKYSPAESSAYFSGKPEVVRRYLRRLQSKIDANAAAFRQCGLTHGRKVVFTVSPFGTLPAFDLQSAFDILGEPVAQKTRVCVAERFESLLEPPVDIDASQPMAVEINVE